MLTERPSENLTATVASVVGSLLIVVAAATKVSIPGEVSGAIVILIGWIAKTVTAYVASKQRAGTLTSGSDGAVS
jgi:hypothetical protein